MLFPNNLVVCIAKCESDSWRPGNLYIFANARTQSMAMTLSRSLEVAHDAISLRERVSDCSSPPPSE
jgi:hypothetical protein